MTIRNELEKLARGDLIQRASRLGVPRPEVLTRVELTDEIVRRLETDEVARRRARGWLGVARDLVASLIEQGLNMPDAAKLVRTGGFAPNRIVHQPPVATVTLAEIYSTQGHEKRALAMLEEVLAKEPDHTAARALRDRILRGRSANEPAAEARLSAIDDEVERDDDEVERDDDEVERDDDEVERDDDVFAYEQELGTAPEHEQPLAASSDLESESAFDEALPLAGPDDEEEAPSPSAAPEPLVGIPLTPIVTEPAPLPDRTAVTEPVADSGSTEPVVITALTPLPSQEPSGGTGQPVVPEHDALVVMRREDGTVCFHWEISARSESRGRELGADGRAVVKVVAVEPSMLGPRVKELELEVAGAVGSAELGGISSRARVRAALGWKSALGFRPLAVGVELERAAGRAPPVVCWRPLALAPLDGLAAAERRAVDAFGARLRS